MIGREINCRETLQSGIPHSALSVRLFCHYFPFEILYTPMTVVFVHCGHKPVSKLIRLLGGHNFFFFTANLNYSHKSIVISMLCVTNASNF